MSPPLASPVSGALLVVGDCDLGTDGLPSSASVNAMGFRVTALFFILIHLYLLRFGKQNMT